MDCLSAPMMLAMLIYHIKYSPITREYLQIAEEIPQTDGLKPNLIYSFAEDLLR